MLAAVLLPSCDAALVPLRCFGLLLSPGKNVKNSDMHLLDLVGLGLACVGPSVSDLCLTTLS